LEIKTGDCNAEDQNWSLQRRTSKLETATFCNARDQNWRLQRRRSKLKIATPAIKTEDCSAGDKK
jgi:hypothetical protein